MPKYISTSAAIFCWLGIAMPIEAISISHHEAIRIGNKIWQNECGGKVAGLTSWNEGEDFASLGIGHFIWYPKGTRGPFEESFPKLVTFISSHGAKLPQFLLSASDSACTWNSCREFNEAQNSSEMKQLRKFLVDAIDLQAEFMVARLQSALPKMLNEAPLFQRPNIQRQFDRLSSTIGGAYALIDYVNFKGEGVLSTERYKGQGWGLLQVLEGMSGSEKEENLGGVAAVGDFSRSAARVLTRRVRNSPPARNEARWLPGWLNRIHTYSNA
jgi:hypothetical protein